MWEAGKIECASVQEEGCLCWSPMQGHRIPCCRNDTFQLMVAVIKAAVVMMVIVLVLTVVAVVRGTCSWW